jgi:hypothetical protein
MNSKFNKTVVNKSPEFTEFPEFDIKHNFI